MLLIDFSSYPKITRYLEVLKIDKYTVVISGPSGVGKGTLIKRLLENYPGTFALSVSHTTRKPREGEENGWAYYFIYPAEFQQMKTEDAFMEFTTFAGNHYGTSKHTIEEQTAKGRVMLLDMDMEGLRRIKERGQKTRSVFILPPSMTELEARLRARGTETAEDIKQRLRRARVEMDFAASNHLYDAMIVNSDIDVAYEELKGVLMANYPF